MRSKIFTLFAFALIASAGAFAQEQTPAAPATPAAAAARPARPMPAQDSVRGNAGKDVHIINATGSCPNGMKAISIVNRSADKPLMARLEVMTTYNGRASKKMITVDNLSAGETRALGCIGCVDNPTGKTCTTYKILAAVYK